MPVKLKNVQVRGNKQDKVLALLSDLPADTGLTVDEILEQIDISPSHLFKIARVCKCSALVSVPGHTSGPCRIFVNPKHLEKWL